MRTTGRFVQLGWKEEQLAVCNYQLQFRLTNNISNRTNNEFLIIN